MVPSGINLPPQYNHFGQIVKGLDVLEAMQSVKTAAGTGRSTTW